MAGSLLRGRVHQGPNPALLKQRLGQMVAPSEVHLMNYGHHAIEIALKVFKRERPERDEVVVPAYICPSVIQAVTACGLQVRSVDVQSDLNMSPADMQAALSDRTLAVIAPHMYGCPARIVEMEALCEAANVFLIDDAAQVVGVQQGGRLLGTFGDVGVISFAQSKTIVTGIRGSGGVLLVNRAVWADPMRKACAALPPASGRLGPWADFLWNHVAHVYTGHSGYYLGRIAGALGWAHQGAAPATAISHLEAGIALAQLDRLDALLADKVRIAQAYHHALQQYPDLAFPQFAPGRFLARVMLLLPEGADMAAVRRAAMARGVESRLGYATWDGAKHAPKAHVFAQRLMGVPCRADMTPADVEGVCAVIAASL